jgi:anti-anti-sigma factor
VLRLDGSLFFVTADALGDRIRELVQGAAVPVRTVVLDCKSVNFIDAQGVEKLGEIADQSRARGVTFRLARVKPGILAVLRRGGVVERVGEEQIHPDVHAAVMAELDRG